MTMRLAAIAFLDFPPKVQEVTDILETIGMTRDKAKSMSKYLYSNIPSFALMPYRKAIDVCLKLDELGCRVIIKKVIHTPHTQVELQDLFPELSKLPRYLS